MVTSGAGFIGSHVAAEVSKAMGVKTNIKYLDARNEVKHAYSSHSKVRGVFGCKTKYSLHQGTSNMVKWAKKVSSKKSKQFKSIDILKNMPKSWLE